MSISLITKPLSSDEFERWRLIMSTFNDGSGQERDSDGNTRLGWRDIERVAAIMLQGHGGEDKQVFDILIPSSSSENFYGCSVKSKQLSLKIFSKLDIDSRVYMELCNSPSKLWDPLKVENYFEADFTAMRYPNEIGKIIIETVEQWHHDYANSFANLNPGKFIDINNSRYLTISYNNKNSIDREYQIHSFPIGFPKNIIWKYNSKRCLRGYDPAHPTETLFDWYALSGGQLKYYPKASTSIFKSPKFKLLISPKTTLEDKASRYFPDDWINAKGNITLTNQICSSEIKNQSKLLKNKKVKDILNNTATEIVKLSNN